MLALIRHAATAWSGRRYCGRTDVPLSRAGRAQVAALVAYLSTVAPARATVLTSPALRCRETAGTIAAALGREMWVDDRLREIDFGDVEGLTFAELEGRWPALAADLLRDDAQVDWPGGERWSEFARRVAAAWDDLPVASADAIVVTHGGPLRLMLRRALPAWPASLPAAPGPAHVVCLTEQEGWSMHASWSPTDVEPHR